MSQRNSLSSDLTVNLTTESVDFNTEQVETIEVNDVPVGTVLQFQTQSSQGHEDDEMQAAHAIINDPGTQLEYIVEDIVDTSHVEVESSSSGDAAGISTSTYLYNQETGEIQLIELNDATTIDSNEVEIVTVDGNSIFSDFPTAPTTSLQIFDGRNLDSQSRVGLNKSQKILTPKKSSSSGISSRLKNAPALLRSSRRPVSVEQSATGVVEQKRKSLKPFSGRQIQPKSVKSSSSKSSSKSESHCNNSRQIILLAEETNNATHISQILSSQNLSVESSGATVQVPSRFYVFQNEEGDQVAELLSGAHMAYGDNSSSVIYQYQLDSGAILLNDVNLANSVHTAKKVRQRKQTKSPKKTEQKTVCPSNLDVPKKANKGGGNSELKCLEEGCLSVAYNVAELRKHLTNFHDIPFDIERREFSSDAVFKEWRQHYERDRMVSFIYRGGTKKISKDQSVTYMICHRSGHYKPTMVDTAKRKRKMKPQGSCKIGGYCTAGIKLLKNLDSGTILADICHTHYGHPLDSEAIPHLRVNPVLKRLIVKKFEEGMNFADMLAYIHHNPDGLEGLRVVDRRAVRNIYDTWKKGPSSNNDQPGSSNDHINSSKSIALKTRIHSNSCESGDEANDLILETTLTPTSPCHETPNTILLGMSLLEETSEACHSDSMNPMDDEDLILKEESAPTLSAVRNEYKDSGDDIEDEGPPLLIAIGSVKSLKLEEETPFVPKKSLKRKRGSGFRKNVQVVMSDSEHEKSAVIKTGSEKEISKKLRCSSTPNEPNELLHQKSLDHCKKTKFSEKSSSISKSFLQRKKKSTAQQDASKSKIKMESKDNPAPALANTNNTISLALSPQKEDSDEDYFDSMHIHISSELEATIDKLHNHGEAGPSILLYKRIGETNAKYGGFCRAFREDDFCLIIQTPVQRQIFQLFPKIVSLEILDSPKPNEHGLKLVFLSVLDDFREAIPVAWMIADSVCTRFLNQFFRMLRYHCGELPVLYIVAPRNADILKSWTTHFSHKPKMLQNESSVKRDLRTLLNRHFPNDDIRTNAWNIVENLLSEKYINNLKEHRTNLIKISKKSPSGKVYLRKMDNDWFPRIREWSFVYRVNTKANLLFATHGFLKLRKFVGFKGTKKLNQNIDNILKIGYDKCFLRTKRMFKGDQKLSNLLEKLDEFHQLAITDLKDVSIIEYPDKNLWKVESGMGGVEYEEVFHLQSPCECKIRCKICTICMHEYMCTCKDFMKQHIMCAHIHKVHCLRSGISLEPKSDQASSAYFAQLETTNSNEMNESAVVRVSGSSFVEKPCHSLNVNGGQESEITVINGHEMEDFNISEVLGLLHGDGQEMSKIVTITDVDTQRVIYDGSRTSPLIFQLDSN